MGAAMSTALRLTLDEFDRMIEQGVFDETRDRRIELINGELREMSPPGPSHEDVIDLLTDWCTANLPRERVRVRVQNSIGIPPSDSAPQPDVACVVQKSYRRRRPLPDEVLLLIEVADSSLRDDRFLKGPLYAAAGIAEYWIVNLPGRCIEVHRNPVDGKYAHVRSYSVGESVAPIAFPTLELPVVLLLGE